MDKENKIDYDLIKEAEHNLKNGEFITVRLLRFFTCKIVNFSVKRNINPNFLTLMMLVTVLIAIPFFLFDNIILLILGFLIIQFFEIFDDADGIVARGTNQLSPYGEQLDYLMHLICHPIMICVFSYNIYNHLNENVFSFISNEYLMIILACVFIIFEYIYRINIDLESLSNLRLNKKKERDGKNGILKCIWRSFSSFPVFMQLFPIFLIIDSIFKINISIYIFIFFIFFWGINVFRMTLKKLIVYAKC